MGYTEFIVETAVVWLARMPYYGVATALIENQINPPPRNARRGALRTRTLDAFKMVYESHNEVKAYARTLKVHHKHSKSVLQGMLGELVYATIEQARHQDAWPAGKGCVGHARSATMASASTTTNVTSATRGMW